MNLSRIIERHAAFAPHKVALHFERVDFTYAMLWQRIERTTAALTARGIRPGDRVAYLGLNDPAVFDLLFALARIGAILLPLNFRLAPAEHAAILQHGGASLLVADAAHAAAACKLSEGIGRKPLSTNVLLDAADGGDETQMMGNDTSPVLLVYTSGTTGKPKGALHTQANLIWNCIASTHAHDLTPTDHVLTVVPLFHVGGLCIQTLPALHAGATVTLHARFDPAAWLRDVAARRPSMSLLVPATLKAVLDHPDCAAADWSSLKLLNTGSSVIPASLIAAVHAKGVPLCQVYGATETGPVSIYLRAEDAIKKAGSAGKAGLHVEVMLADAQGTPVPHGAVGEIRIRGLNVMQGYWNDADNLSFQDGWFATGDLAYQDTEGFYTVVGRSKDMIISGGENIYPAELENILADCAAIAEAAVVGLDDARWGEATVAVVVKMPDATLDEAGVMQLFDGRLARFKHPRRVVFTDALPKTALGKVQKAELRAELIKRLA